MSFDELWGRIQGVAAAAYDQQLLRSPELRRNPEVRAALQDIFYQIDVLRVVMAQKRPARPSRPGGPLA